MSCGTTKEVLISVQSPSIPAQLTADCPRPDIPETVYWDDFPQLLADSMNSIAKYNLGKKSFEIFKLSEKIQHCIRTETLA
ncbi:TPA: hypothetical protein ACKRTE_001468 [Providencia rettgeri]